MNWVKFRSKLPFIHYISWLVIKCEIITVLMSVGMLGYIMSVMSLVCRPRHQLIFLPLPSWEISNSGFKIYLNLFMDQSLSHFVRVRSNASFEMWKVLGAGVDMHTTGGRISNILSFWCSVRKKTVSAIILWWPDVYYLCVWNWGLGGITLYNQKKKVCRCHCRNGKVTSRTLPQKQNVSFKAGEKQIVKAGCTSY